MKNHTILTSIPALSPILETANHVDIKTVTGYVTLQEFLANMFSYYPSWLKALYRIRWGFVRLLGMKQEGIPQQVRVHPSDVPMTPNEKVGFFTVDLVEEPRYWFTRATESHLTARLGVVTEPAPNGATTFHVVTIVHYHNWTGPVYFNVIRPFHHIVVSKMAKAGLGSLNHGQENNVAHLNR